MLVKITTRCNGGCPHCLDDCQAEGLDMQPLAFDQAVWLSKRIDPLPLIVISGGEPMLHPAFWWFIDFSINQGLIVAVTTNGTLLDEELVREKLEESEQLSFQVTYDPRLYAKEPPRIEHSRISYTDAVPMLMRLGRYKGEDYGIPEYRYPPCFNLRAATIAHGDIGLGIATLRQRSRYCCPIICTDGSIRVGESVFCTKIGTINSSPKELTEAVRSVRCDACGLTKNLNQEQKRAVGESVLYSPHEDWRRV